MLARCFKKSVKVRLFILALISILLLAIFFGMDSYEYDHEKPSNVPNDAFFIGGNDGGIFLLIKSGVKSDQYDVVVYNDYTGGVEFEGVLHYKGHQNFNKMYANPEMYDAWDGERLYLINNEVLTQ